MSAVVCQNIRSSFDTLLMEPKSLSLKLNPPKLQLSQESSTPAGWSSIEALSTASNIHKGAADNLQVYVYPLVKRSSCMLSDKSLKMCTENLGSETGTDITSEDDIFSIRSLDLEGEESTSIAREERIRKVSSRNKMQARKAGYESLPPPLTTISGANTIRVQPHRESGRLVMTAVTTPPRRCSIFAERCNGRLTMSLNDDFFDDLDEEEDETREDKSNDETEMERMDEEAEESVEEEEEEAASLEEDIDVINKEVGGKFGIGEFQRLTMRCKEGEHGSRRLINLKTFWVAT